MAKPFTYLTDCVSSDGPSITAMVDAARKVSLRTFRQHCDCAAWEQSIGYERDPRHGLTLNKDRFVKFYKSRYRGTPCYFAVWSAIEYVFTRKQT